MALRRVLDHYLHTAWAADRLLYPLRWPLIELAAAGPGVTIGDGLASHAGALAWFDAEHHALVSAIKAAADGGFDVHACQLAWTMETFFHRRGHWRDWSAAQYLALAAAQRLGNRFAQRCASRGIGSAELELGRHDVAVSYMTETVRLCQEDGDLATEARVHVDLSRALGAQRRWAEALVHSRQGLILARARGQVWPAEADALNLTGWSLAMLSRFSEALTFCQQAVALHRRLGNEHGEPCALDSLAYTHQGLGNHAQAAQWYHRAIELYAKLGYQYPRAETPAYAGTAHQASGDIDAARDAWTQALAILENLHHPLAGEVRAKLAFLDSGPAGRAGVGGPVRTGTRGPGPAPSATAIG
jgi:tetratricopeptide (TPR) repeat protein